MSADQRGDGSKRLWIGLGLVVVGVLALLALDLLSSSSGGPPPPQPLTALAPMVGPVAPPPPVSQERTTHEAEARMAQEEKRAAAAAEEPEPKLPPLRMQAKAVPALKIQRQYVGGSGSRSNGVMVVRSVYRGKEVHAEVVVNGVWKGTTPMNLNLPEGMYRVRLDYPGAPVNELVTAVSRGRSEKMSVELRAQGQKDAPLKVSKKYRE